jgi:hypothetical protein
MEQNLNGFVDSKFRRKPFFLQNKTLKMRKFLISILLALTIANTEFIYEYPILSGITCSGLNHLESATFQSMLSSNKYVLAFWYTRDCQKCGPMFWDVNYSIYLYGYLNSVRLHSILFIVSILLLLQSIVRRMSWL